jgi:hypothetical protein
VLDVVGPEGVLHIPEPWLGTTGKIELTRKGVTEHIPADSFSLTVDEQDAYRIEFDTFEQVVAGTCPSLSAAPTPSPSAWLTGSGTAAQVATLEAVLRGPNRRGHHPLTSGAQPPSPRRDPRTAPRQSARLRHALRTARAATSLDRNLAVTDRA